MIEQQEMIAIEVSALIERVQQMQVEKFRLVQIGCTKCSNDLELNYSFDKEGRFVNLRIRVPAEGAVIPSISGIYLAGFLYENEIHDLFGVTVNDMALDYKGNFYKTTVKWPFNQPSGKGV